MVYVHKDPTIEAGVLQLVLSEMSRVPNEPALAEALLRHGYALRDTGAGWIVTTVPHGVDICRLPYAPSFSPAT